jgi:hypothetical protein
LHDSHNIDSQSFSSSAEDQAQHALNRRAAVLAAANAAATWARTRRSAWTDAPLQAHAKAAAPLSVAVSKPASAFSEPAVVFTEPEVTFSEPIAFRAPEVAFGDSFGFSEPAVVPESLAAKIGASFSLAPIVGAARNTLSTAVAMARPLGAPLLHWLPRVAAVVAVAAMAVAVLATGRSYWRQWTAVSKTGVAVLESVPDGSQVTVDGNDAGKTPIAATLPVGSHTIEFRYRKQVRTVRVSVDPDGRVVQRVDWSKKPTGRLVISSGSTSARVLVDGAMRGMTPLTLDDLAVGPHVVRFESVKGSVQRSVTIADGQTAQVEETIFPGWLLLDAPIELTITEGTRAIRLDDRSQAMLPPGPHELRLENRALGYQEVRQVEVRPGETARVSIAPRRSTVNVTATAPAEVWFDGVAVGRTPLVDLPVEIGTHDVRLKSAAGERRLTALVTVKPLDLNVDFSERPSR